MEEVESTIPIAKKPSKKSNKHYHLALSTSKLRTSSSHSSRTLPPSFTKVQSPPSGKTSSRSQDRFSGLWEWYYNEEEGGETSEEAGVSEDSSLLKNIRGFLMKRRKSPLKGWHKRYFVLEKGILYFSRSYAQMVKGKVSGTLDLGYAFIHYDGSSRRIDVDGENHVLHLKVYMPVDVGTSA